MPTITYEDLERDDPVIDALVADLMLREDQRILVAVKAAQRRARLKHNRRKRAARARTGRRT